MIDVNVVACKQSCSRRNTYFLAVNQSKMKMRPLLHNTLNPIILDILKHIVYKAKRACNARLQTRLMYFYPTVAP
jgi:hypothetical protein